MDQMTLFAPSYRYIIDTSSILSQKPTEPHRRQVYKSLWNKIDDYIRRGVIVTCSEVAEEIKDKSIDFVLYNINTGEIYACIELDDSTHENEDRKKRDILLEKMFNDVLNIIHFKSKNEYTESEILNKLKG